MGRRPPLFAGVVVAVLLAVAGLATPSAAPQQVGRAGAAPDGRGRIVAIGDIHGAYPQFVGLLRQTGLIDDQGRWAGGQATLVQTGDFLDRGGRIQSVMDLLMTLEQQAEAAGGRAIVLLGNHEAMNLTSLMQDVSPEAVASFADDRSQQRRVEAYEQYERFLVSRRRELGRDPPGVMAEAEWMEAHPPGLIEYLEAFAPDGRYGRWLRERDAAVEVEGTVFLHGGLNPEFAAPNLRELNDRVRDEIRRFDASRRQLLERRVILPFFTFDEIVEAAAADLKNWVDRLQRPASFVSPSLSVDRPYLDMLVNLLELNSWSIVHEDGPLWFRGFASWSTEEGAPQVDALQQRYRAARFVVGHTIPETFRIVPRFDNRVFLIDTGMLSDVYKGGRPSALEIVGEQVTAIYGDGRVPLVEAVTQLR